MQTHNIKQGSPEWHTYRASHFNASDAPAMLGVSSYKSRSQLIKEMATKSVQDVDAMTQKRFNDGHRFEALARPLAESIIGEELYPVVGSEGKLSASFDGITMLENIIFEHKTLNQTLENVTYQQDLPLQYRVQIEQQLFVSGAEKCLFMASKWTEDDKYIGHIKAWVMPDLELRQRIIEGWALFENDLLAFKKQVISDESLTLAEQYAELDKKIKAIEAEKEAVKKKLQSIFDDSVKIGRITISVTKQYEQKQTAADYVKSHKIELPVTRLDVPKISYRFLVN